MMVAARASHREGHREGHGASHREGHGENQVIIDVIDHGKGVPDEHKPLIFEPFERLGDRNTGTGVGLGLAVAKGFLHAMGGEIEALDTPGGGLTMRVTLPVAPPSPPPAAPNPDPAAEPASDPAAVPAPVDSVLAADR